MSAMGTLRGAAGLTGDGERHTTMRSMDSILADEPSVHTMPESESDSSSTSAETEVKTSEGVKPEPVEAKDSTKAEAADDTDSSDPDPTDFSAVGLRKALTAERKQRREERKRAQALQSQLDQLTGEARVLREKPAAQSTEAKQEESDAEFYANPVAFVRKYGAAAAPDIEGMTAKVKIDISEVYARQAHEDYDEKRDAFMEAANKNPQLWTQLAASPSPAEFAYKTGADALEMGDGGLDAWRERERAKIRAELSGETVETVEKPAKVLPKPSNAGARGSGANVKQAWSGPRSMNQILGR